jgi:hypothetical protein
VEIFEGDMIMPKTHGPVFQGASQRHDHDRGAAVDRNDLHFSDQACNKR